MLDRRSQTAAVQDARLSGADNCGVESRNQIAVEKLAMTEDDLRRQVDEFILNEIDTVPHLEALLLLWNRRPQGASLDELTKALYVSSGDTHAIVQDLEQRGLVRIDADRYYFDPGFNRKHLIESLDRIYRREVVRISTMIHSKASPSVREFARAFRFKKD